MCMIDIVYKKKCQFQSPSFGKVSNTAASKSLKKRESFRTFTMRSAVKLLSLVCSSTSKGFL